MYFWVAPLQGRGRSAPAGAAAAMSRLRRAALPAEEAPSPCLGSSGPQARSRGPLVDKNVKATAALLRRGCEWAALL